MLSPDQTNIVVARIEDQLMQEEPIIANEEVATSSNGDPITDKNTSIIKGKRTKRQRPQSPISFCLNLEADNNTTNINAPESEESRSDICINIQDMSTNANTKTLLSDDWHSYKTKEDDDEEEEVANCLILLAQGKPRYLCKNSNNDDDYYKQPTEQKKFTSKKFLETPYGDKAGYYVYECKTCFKTFPSFQALGGHRASHVKPKREEEKTNNRMLFLDEGKTTTTHVYYTPTKGNNLNTYDDNHMNNNNNNNNNNKKPRIHECSTCGAEFLSGQALGGHMRSHRAPTGARVLNNISSGSRHNHDDNYFVPQLPSLFSPSSLSFMSTSMVANTARMENDGRPPPSAVEAKKMFLNLDLNLAAPVEDESTKIQSAAKEQYKQN